jgi:hypothetical protein
MKVQAIRCNSCRDVIYSRARHDCRECTCGNCYVDGGFDYFRYGGEDFDKVTVDVDSSKELLYLDWNKRRNKFGLKGIGSKQNKVSQSG